MSLPGVWKLILRSSTGSVGWWEDMALLHGKLPFLPSASALFLHSQHTSRYTSTYCSHHAHPITALTTHPITPPLTALTTHIPSHLHLLQSPHIPSHLHLLHSHHTSHYTCISKHLLPLHKLPIYLLTKTATTTVSFSII